MFLYKCDYQCRSIRCPAAVERIAAGWHITVTVVPGGTQLTDVNGNMISSSLVNGTIAVSLRSVPEPSAVLLVAVGGGLIFLPRSRRTIAA